MVKPKYNPVGEELSTEVAYLQAAGALDNLVFEAIEVKDLKRLAAAAVLWMELGERLMNGPEEDEEQPQQVSVGFTGAGKGEYERVE